MTTIIKHNRTNGLADRILRESRERKLLLTIVVTLPADLLDHSNQDLHRRALLLTGAVASCEPVLDPRRKMGAAGATLGVKNNARASIDKQPLEAISEK